MKDTTIITYNRQSKQYECTNGRIYATFPNGRTGQQSALIAAIQHDTPDAYDAAHTLIAQIYPHRSDLHGRIWQAADILRNRRLYAPHPLATHSNAITAHALSSDGSWHTVYTSDALAAGRCSCPDILYNQSPAINGRPTCKHMIAYNLAKMIGYPLEWPQIPPVILFPDLTPTGRHFEIIGVVNGRSFANFHPYRTPQTRQAYANEVVKTEMGELWRVVQLGNGRITFYAYQIPDRPQPAPPVFMTDLTQEEIAALFNAPALNW